MWARQGAESNGFSKDLGGQPLRPNVDPSWTIILFKLERKWLAEFVISGMRGVFLKPKQGANSFVLNTFALDLEDSV